MYRNLRDASTLYNTCVYYLINENRHGILFGKNVETCGYLCKSFGKIRTKIDDILIKKKKKMIIKKHEIFDGKTYLTFVRNYESIV